MEGGQERLNCGNGRLDQTTRAVLVPYGWTEIPTGCKFFPSTPTTRTRPLRPKRKPHGYPWLNEIHDEILARLLDLNTHGATDERAATAHGRSPRTKR